MPCEILVLDDDALICMASADALRAAGYAVAEAQSADAARAVLHRDHPRLLVADIDLGPDRHGKPGPTGLDVAADAHALLPDLAVIYATGRPRALAIHHFAVREAWLEKPFAPAQLARLAHAMIGQPDPAPA